MAQFKYIEVCRLWKALCILFGTRSPLNKADVSMNTLVDEMSEYNLQISITSSQVSVSLTSHIPPYYSFYSVNILVFSVSHY